MGVIIFCVFVGFSGYAQISFGHSEYNYSSFPRTIRSLFSIILREMDYHALHRVDRSVISTVKLVIGGHSTVQ